MDAWSLPTKLNINGNEWEIRTDYRVILDIINALSDPDLDNEDKWLACLIMLYPDFQKMPQKDYKAACLAAREFIDMGLGGDDKQKKPRAMDWEQDAQLIIPAVNKVLGKEVRALDYMHWWTFLSSYMEIGDCTFSHILNIRTKKIKGKPLEKWEKEFERENSDIVTLKRRLSSEELAEEQEENKILEELFG